MHGYALDDAGVVDQDVDCPDLFLYLGHEGLYLSLVGHIADVAVGLDAQPGVGGESLLHQFGPDVVEYDGGSGLCVGGGYGEADSVGCAGHQRDLAFE